MNIKTRCGYVAIIGRSNVGKSTLLNKILGQKISITARKSQTTRHQILGIKTIGGVQALYVDTPGMHSDKRRALNRHMLKATKDALVGVDVVVFVVDAFAWRKDDDLVLALINNIKIPVILVVNKIDTIKDKEGLLPHIKMLSEKLHFNEIIPLSAQKGTSVDHLESAVFALLPEAPIQYAEDELTDKSIPFMVTEVVREKLTRLLGQEVPHELTVIIEEFVEEEHIVKIAALIYVARKGQKAIVVGQKGSVLKRVGSEARADIERLLSKKVFIQLWVKVKKGWYDDESKLREFGY